MSKSDRKARRKKNNINENEFSPSENILKDLSSDNDSQTLESHNTEEQQLTVKSSARSLSNCFDKNMHHFNNSRQVAPPYLFQLNVDAFAVILFILGLVTRLPFLEQPEHVVFDEMHYGKYASMYLKRTFFFDGNPPLGKMLIASMGYLVGFKGNFSFDRIGVAYPDHVPIVALRFVPAFYGALLAPTLYLVLGEIGLSNAAPGLIASFMYIFDTALFVQSRFILLEPIMMFYGFSALFSILKYRKHSVTPFSPAWYFWIISTAVNMGLAFCVKYLAFYSCVLCTVIFFVICWRRLALRNISGRYLLLEFLISSSILCVVPVAIYISIFYAHLGILNKAGVHDSFMTSAFQASLEGGLSSIVKGQPLHVVHGSQVTLRHTFSSSSPCWLHSHEHLYPVRYPDSRGSSHQQQVSCYTYKDVNNWWIIKKPDMEDLAVHEPLNVIRDGDVIQLVHGMTHRALNSHDVAAPMSPQNQEVSCYIDYNISMEAENLWRVEIVNKASNVEEDGHVWKSIGSQIRLVHVTTNRALKTTGKRYPEWGFYQGEVCADKSMNDPDTVWNVEEHRYTQADDTDAKSLEKELIVAELIPTGSTYMSFWEKFFELQIKMLLTNQENVQNHNYASDPTEWPFLTRGIAYYIDAQSNAQVHLIGNIIIWYMGTLCLVTYCGLLIFYMLRRRRACNDIATDLWKEFVDAGEILFLGYLVHYIPFFFYDRTLFLHHYLPAYVFKIMLTGFFLHHIKQVVSTFQYMKYILGLILCLLFCLWIYFVILFFIQYSVLCYGVDHLTKSEVNNLRWKDTWDLIIHKS